MASLRAGRLKDIFSLRLYSRVARLGNFSAAARDCGLSQSQASRIIADLEADLGVRLLSRTTRAVVPTEAGLEFLTRIEPILADLDEAEHFVRDGGELRGLLRISMPTSVGVRAVIPRLSAFTAMHPDLHVQFLLEDKRQDLIRDAVDVAIRVGRLPQSDDAAMLIATTPRVFVASPGYLNRHGVPATPGDLAEHRIIRGPCAAVPYAWTFDLDEGTVAIDPGSHVSMNENEGAVAAATAGLGITVTYGWAVQRELEDGSLVRLFSDLDKFRSQVYAYFPMGRATRTAGRMIIEYLAAEFCRDMEVAPS